MSRTIARSVRNPGVHVRVGALAFALLAAAGWLSLALLDLVVRAALFRRHRSEGTVSVLWGLGFALFLWFGLWAIKVQEPNAILFAVVAGAAIALFVYLRGAALEAPPVEQPGVAVRRRLASGRGSRPRRTVPAPSETTRELHQVRVELAHGELESALFLLGDAERVAVAQRKLGELLEVRELLGAVLERSSGRTIQASRRLERRIRDDLASFPPAELAAAGVRVELGRPRTELPTTELGRARAAIEEDYLTTALFLLRQARRVAIAQGRPSELREVAALAALLSDRGDDVTQATSKRLARQVEADLATHR